MTGTDGGPPARPPFSADFQRRFELMRPLGQGGMGTVWLANHVALGRPVAIKVLHTLDAEQRERFRREAQFLATLEHPHVVRVLDAGEDSGLPYLIMELLDGPSLSAGLAGGPLAPAAAAEIAAQLADALAYAHERGVVHRDVKPDNIFLVEPLKAKLGDFGIARWVEAGRTLTAPDTILGTPAYMSPEQVLGQRLDPATDQYAMGLVLYEMLTGALPFAGSSALELARARLEQVAEPPSRSRPGIPAELDAIVMIALALQPEKRHAGCGVMRDQLRRVAQEARVVRGPRTAPATARLSRRGPALTLVTNLPPPPPRRPPRVALAVGLGSALAGLALWDSAHRIPSQNGSASPSALAAVRSPTPLVPAAAGPPLQFTIDSFICVPTNTSVLVAFERAAAFAFTLSIRRSGGGKPVHTLDVPAGSAFVRRSIGPLEPDTQYVLDLEPHGRPGGVRGWTFRTLGNRYAEVLAQLKAVNADVLVESVVPLLRNNPFATDDVAQLMVRRLSMKEAYGWGSMIAFAREIRSPELVNALRPAVEASSDEPPQGTLLGAAARVGDLRALDDIRKRLQHKQPPKVQRDWVLAMRLKPDPQLFDAVLGAFEHREDFDSRELAPAMLATGREWARGRFTPWVHRLETNRREYPRRTRAALQGLLALGEAGDLAVVREAVEGKFGSVTGDLAAVVLGESTRPEARALLEARLQRGPLTASLAWSAARAGIAPAERGIAAALAGQGRPDVRAQFAFALGEMHGREGLDALRAALADPSDEVAVAAGWALASRQDRTLAWQLLELAGSPRDPEGIAALALGRMGVRDAIPTLKKRLAAVPPVAEGLPLVRRGALIWALALLGEAETPAPDADLFVRECARAGRSVAQGKAAPPRFFPARIPWSFDREMKAGEWIDVTMGGATLPSGAVSRITLPDTDTLLPRVTAWLDTQLEELTSTTRVLAKTNARLAWAPRSTSALYPIPAGDWTGLAWITVSPGPASP